MKRRESQTACLMSSGGNWWRAQKMGCILSSNAHKPSSLAVSRALSRMARTRCPFTQSNHKREAVAHVTVSKVAFFGFIFIQHTKRAQASWLGCSDKRRQSSRQLSD